MAISTKPAAEKGGAKDTAAPAKSYRVAKTRLASRAIGGSFPAEPVLAFRVLAAAEEKDVQQLLAEAINLLFERKGVKERIPVFSGRRTRASAGAYGRDRATPARR